MSAVAGWIATPCPNWQIGGDYSAGARVLSGYQSASMRIAFPIRPSADLPTSLQRRRVLRLVAAVAVGCALLGGCAEEFQKGYIIPEGALEQIPIGASQDQVLIVMGTPSTVATLSGEVFYYISQRTQRRAAFMPQDVTDQRVVAVYFDQARHVERIANYGMKDGKVFDYISRTTSTGGQEMSYLAPLFRLLSNRGH
jgi:outer membrane protein assembly factor BamE (lipoprotein component of BamABCDE complex)